MRAVVWLTGLLVLLGCSGLLGGPVDPSDDTEVVFEVPKGATARRVGQELVEQGLFGNELAWRVVERTHDVGCFKAGKHTLRRSMTSQELVAELCAAPLANDVPFTVLEGWRIRDVDAALTSAGLIEAGAYADIALSKGVDAPFPIESPTYEGYLWPETYMVNADDFDPGRLITRQLETFHEKFVKHHTDFGSRSLHDIVVMASLLEREEPSPANRPLVAGILWKRIDNGWQLGVDATSRYTIEKWNDRRAFLKQLRDPDDPYNTRINKGLPPTAIGAPTLPSLDAALNPKPSPYWYYLHDSKKNLHPARDAAEHERNRAKYDVY